MAKMVDVARHAGVSIKTVSRVLNNEPHVRETLRDKVRKSVEALGYVPSASARNLRSNRTYTIHLVSHSLRSNFVNAIQFGALQACQERGYRMAVSMVTPGMAENEETLRAWCDNLVKAGKPDGLILMPPMSNVPIVSEIVSDAGIPIVRIGPNRIRDKNATVTIDDQAAARSATEYLIELGHRRIAFVRGKEDQDATHERFAGYQRALADHDIGFDPSLIAPGLFDFETGLAAGDKFLAFENPPTAVFAANDDMAAGVLVAAHRKGISVPDDLSIIGFDDSEIAEKMWPALTTVRQPLQDLGSAATSVLIGGNGWSSSETNSRTKFLPYELITRQSTGPVGED
ncbi:MAG: LacI family DNA-binding transcriptional regulator [Pseudomonadota bacterium]